jgi:aminoglycoside 6'-N-acetyltransferase I
MYLPKLVQYRSSPDLFFFAKDVVVLGAFRLVLGAFIMILSNALQKLEVNMEDVSNIKIEALPEGEEIPYNLLLLSDDAKEAINSNLRNGELYMATLNKEVIGAFILKVIEIDTIEIKNIAVTEQFQGNGIGTILLQFIIRTSRERKFQSLIVGTCDQCHREIRFYEKSGFKPFAVRKDFFIHNYGNPIFENGIQIRDMIMLQINLQQEVAMN